MEYNYYINKWKKRRYMLHYGPNGFQAKASQAIVIILAFIATISFVCSNICVVDLYKSGNGIVGSLLMAYGGVFGVGGLIPIIIAQGIITTYMDKTCRPYSQYFDERMILFDEKIEIHYCDSNEYEHNSESVVYRIFKKRINQIVYDEKHHLLYFDGMADVRSSHGSRPGNDRFYDVYEFEFMTYFNCEDEMICKLKEFAAEKFSYVQ